MGPQEEYTSVQWYVWFEFTLFFQIDNEPPMTMYVRNIFQIDNLTHHGVSAPRFGVGVLSNSTKVKHCV